LIERIIENWLDSSDERTYQISFCQLLVTEGFRVLHISSHGMMEQGKDVIAIDPDGRPVGFQLKAGDISLSKWRSEIKGEIDELIELPIVHPGIQNQHGRRAILVTTGGLSDPVRRAIDDRNRASARHRPRYPRLDVITKGDLVRRFVQAHGTWLPSALPEFSLFLKLLVADPRALPDKRSLAAFFSSFLPLTQDEEVAMRLTQSKRAIASAVLLGSYILSGYEKAENWVALIEGWSVCAAHILAVVERFGISEPHYSESLSLCKRMIDEGSENLTKEVLGRTHYSEGNPMSDDTVIYRSRVTMTFGCISAWLISCRLDKRQNLYKKQLSDIFAKNISLLLLWGEASVPFFVSISLAIELAQQSALAEDILIGITKSICVKNGLQSTSPLDTPYEDMDGSLKQMIGLPTEDVRDPRTFVGFSYSIEALVEMIARRLRKQALRMLWRDITGLTYCKFQPPEKWRWFLWRNQRGLLRTHLPKHPEKWEELLRRSTERQATSLPLAATSNAWFLPFFLLSHPHRFDVDSAALVDGLLSNSPEPESKTNKN
jgi:hypothetical protein